MDLRRLREETRREHEATEAAMPLLSPDLTLETYIEVLRLLLPVLQSWEAWSAGAAPPTVRPLLAARRRSTWIEQDLSALHAPPAARNASAAEPIAWAAVVSGASDPPASTLCSPRFTAAFLGAWYVLEGSTLGGRFIAKHVEGALGLVPGHGDAYFRGHGEQTGVLWRETTAALAAVPEDQADFLIAAAKRTFQAFGAVLGTGEPVRTAFI